MPHAMTMQKDLTGYKKTETIVSVCENLTDVQVEKMQKLAEGVDFETEDQYSDSENVENFDTVNLEERKQRTTYIIETDETGQVYKTNQYLQYINRGSAFKHFCLYDYAATVSLVTAKTKTLLGRKKNAHFSFIGNDLPKSCYQRLRSKFLIPILTHPNPPTYP